MAARNVPSGIRITGLSELLTMAPAAMPPVLCVVGTNAMLPFTIFQESACLSIAGPCTGRWSTWAWPIASSSCTFRTFTAQCFLTWTSPSPGVGDRSRQHWPRPFRATQPGSIASWTGCSPLAATLRGSHACDAVSIPRRCPFASATLCGTFHQRGGTC